MSDNPEVAIPDEIRLIDELLMDRRMSLKKLEEKGFHIRRNQMTTWLEGPNKSQIYFPNWAYDLMNMASRDGENHVRTMLRELTKPRTE